MTYVEVASRLLLVTVFGFALAGKVAGRRAWAGFVESVAEMGVAGGAAVAVAVAVAEGAVAVLLLTPASWAGTAGFTLAAGLLGCFTVAVALVIRRGDVVPCRCFGPSRTPIGTPQLVRDLVLVAVSLIGLAASLLDGPFDPVLGTLAGVLGAVLGLLITRWEDLAALVRAS